MSASRPRKLRRWLWISLIGLVLILIGVATTVWLRDEPPPDLSDLQPLPPEFELGNRGYRILQRAIAAADIDGYRWEVPGFYQWVRAPTEDEARSEARALVRAHEKVFAILDELKSEPSITAPAGTFTIEDAGLCGILRLYVLESILAYKEGNVSAAVEAAGDLRRLGEQLVVGACSVTHFNFGLRVMERGQDLLGVGVRHPRITERDLQSIEQLEAPFREISRAALLRVLRAHVFRMQRNLQDMGEIYEKQHGWPLKPNRAVRRAREVIRKLIEQEQAAGRDFSSSGNWSDYYVSTLTPQLWPWLTGDAASEAFAAALPRGLVQRMVWRRIVDARRSLLHLAVALRRYHLDHGKLPSTVEELIPEYLEAIPNDPFSGRPVKYSPETEVVYSVNWNGSDELGTERDECDIALDVKFPPRE